MESASIPEHPKRLRSRPFQFSLAEAMSITVFIGAMLCIRHNGIDSGSLWQDDIWLIVMVLIASALGEWWSAHLGTAGWRRKIRIVTLVTVALAMFASFAGVRYLHCWRCGAVHVEKYGLFSYVEQADDSDVSARVEKLCTAKCKHAHWRFGTSYNIEVISDGFPDRDVPILFNESSVVDLLEKIPNTAWRLTLVDSMGDSTNRLKFITLVIVQDLSRKQPKTQAEWDAWWNVNQPIFAPEKNLAKALPLAQTVICRLRFNRYNNTDWVIKRDLPGIVLP